MAQFWLTPLPSFRPLTLGAERIRCVPPDELQKFRDRLNRLSPRLLPLFKARMLAAEAEAAAGPEGSGAARETVCGASDAGISLSAAGDIVFDERPLALSSCGQALLDRLLSPAEALDRLERIVPNECSEGLLEEVAPSAADVPAGSGERAVSERSGWTPAQRLWLAAMKRWSGRGWYVILLREDETS